MPNLYAEIMAGRQCYTPGCGWVFLCIAGECIPVTLTRSGKRTYVILRSIGTLGDCAEAESRLLADRPVMVELIKRGRQVSI